MLKPLNNCTCLAYVNHELPDVQAGFRKGRGNRDHSVIFEIARVRTGQELELDMEQQTGSK